MTLVSRPARIAARSLVKRKTSTGAVKLIGVTTAAKCGGAVASPARKHLGATKASTIAKTRKRKTRRIMRRTKIKAKSTSGAPAARRSVTRLKHAQETPI